MGQQYAYAEVIGNWRTTYRLVRIVKQSKRIVEVEWSHTVVGADSKTVFTKRKTGEWLEKDMDGSKFQKRLRFDTDVVEQIIKERDERREATRRQNELLANFQRKLRQIAGRRNLSADLETVLMECLEKISHAEEQDNEQVCCSNSSGRV